MINRLKTIEFHFVLNHTLKEKLISISNFLNLNLSKTIIFILENMSPLLDKMHFIYKEENRPVEKVNWDAHLHIYMNRSKEVLYNKLKSIHKDNNTYSIATGLRYILKVFLRGVEMYGLNKFLKVLKDEKEKRREENRNKKIWFKKTKVRQLSYNKCLSVQYDYKYSVVLIKLLN
ncbi:MAG: hypothetical protein JXB50_08890 [Spirochaetes bacterium]|nr:hypothetical protein [Spirochaetota bacterium]